MLAFQIVLLVLLFLFRRIEGIDGDECLRMGFNPIELKCNSCEAVSKVSSKLQEHCMSCCIPVATAPKEVFALIVLEVDKRFVDEVSPLYPEVARLIKKSQESSSNKVSASPFSSFATRYVFGTRPILRLYKERDDEFPDDSVPVGNWSADVIKDFLLENSG
jgi:hypothetical protein